MIDYFKNINELTKQNGLTYYKTNMLTSVKFDIGGKIDRVTGLCNSFLCAAEFSGESLFHSNCQCIIGRNGVVCKHVAALIYAYIDKKNEIEVNEFPYLKQITTNSNVIHVFNELIHLDKLFILSVINNDFSLERNDPIRINTLISEYNEVTNVFAKCLESSILTPEQRNTVLKLQDIYNWIYTYNEIIRDTSSDLIFSFSLEELIMNHNNLLMLKINNNRYALDLINNVEKNVEIFTTKTSLGFLIHANIQDGTYIVDHDNLIYFLVYSDRIEWFMSRWDGFDNPNLIFKLNQRTKNETNFRNKLSEIKNATLFVPNVHFQNIHETEHNQIIFGYDIKLQACVLNINAYDIPNLVKKYFSKFATDFDYQTNTLQVTDRHDIAMILNKLKIINQKTNIQVIVSKIFLNKNKRKIYYRFSQTQSKLKLRIETDIDPQYLPTILAAYNAGKRYITINEDFVDLDEFDFNNLKGILAQISNEEITMIKPTYEFELNNIFYLNSKFKNPELDKYINELNLDIQENRYIKNDFIEGLKNYQIYGVNWLIKILEISHGCILADEMGLGKTLETITLLKYFYQNDNLPTLIVLPLSLVSNWISEFKRFDPERQVVELTGSVEERRKLIKGIKNNTIYLTTYNLINYDIEEFKNHEFLNLILDEGQYIKNSMATWTKKIKSIKAVNKMILSGTPIENNLLELWSIFDFILPGYLGSLHMFKKEYINKNNDDKSLYELSLKIKPFILQRKKVDHIRLPDKKTVDIIIKMTPTESGIYKNLLANVKEKLVVSVDKEGNIVKNRIEILALITKLRQFCCSSALVNINNQDNTKINELVNLLATIIERDSKAKIVIFSNFTSALKIIGEKLNENGYNPLMMTGEDHTKERDEIIKEFNVNMNRNILLLSLKAGGVGLNLTSANNVIHFNPWWNESAELQATDRLHRIGQEREVHVYKLIYKDSIEEDIQTLKNKKVDIINKTINDFAYKDLLKILRDK